MTNPMCTLRSKVGIVSGLAILGMLGSVPGLAQENPLATPEGSLVRSTRLCRRTRGRSPTGTA